jgi:amino acid transporter
MIAVSLIYVATQTVTIEFLGNSLAGEKLPVAAAFGIIGGQMGQSLILSGMLVSILGVAIAVSFDTPVELASMAHEHQLMPDWLARQNRYGAPYWAIILTTALAGGLVVSGEYIFLVKLIVFSSFIQYIATIASLIKLRNDQTLGVGMRLPGGLLLPIASLLLITYLLTSFAMVTVLIGLGFAAVGLVIHEVERAIKQKNK